MKQKQRRFLRGMILPIIGLSLFVASAASCRNPAAPSIPSVTGIRIEAESDTIVRGETMRLEAVVYGTDNPPQTVNWYIVNGDRSPGTGIDADGYLHVAASESSSVIRVGARSTFDTRRFGHLDIYLQSPPITGVTMLVPDQMLEETHTFTLSARVEPADTRYPEIRWEIPEESHRAFVEISSYDRVAGTAVVRGLAAGEARVYAVSVASPEHRASVGITVFPLGAGVPIEGIDIGNNRPIELEVGDSVNLDIEFTPDNTTQRGFGGISSAPHIAAVSWVDGVLRVTGVYPGSAAVTVTSTARPDLSDTIQVIVRATPTGVTVTPSSVSVPLNRTQQFEHTVLGSAGVSQAVTWTIDPSGAGTVVNGLLTLNETAESTVTVIATTECGSEYGTAIVTVLGPVPTGVIVTPSSVSVPLNRTQQFSHTVVPAGAPQAVTWAINPSGAGSIVNGLLTLNETAEGTVTVIATTECGSEYGTAIVTVLDPQGGSLDITFPDLRDMAENIPNQGPVFSMLGIPGEINFNAAGFNVTNVEWLIGERLVPPETVTVAGTVYTLTLNSLIHGNSEGTHHVTLRVTVDGNLYSRVIAFTVGL